MTQNPSPDVVRPSMHTKKSRPLRPRFVRCWRWWECRLEYIQNASTSIQFISLSISPPSMLDLKGFQQGLSGYVDGLSIKHSIQPLLATLTFSPWKGLSNSVLSFAHGIASEDLDPNAWRHHESETNVQTEDVLQATHWMHSMTAHAQGILWKWLNIKVRVGVAVPSPGNPKSFFFWVIINGQIHLNPVKDSFLVIDQKEP